MCLIQVSIQVLIVSWVVTRVSLVYTNQLGVEVLVSAKAIEPAGWYLAGFLPTAEAFASIRSLQQRMLIATLLLTLLVSGLTWWILQRQLLPLTVTAKTLIELSEINEHPELLPIHRQDEIGQLIGGFNRLLETLGKRDTALQEVEWKFQALFEKGPIGVAYHKMIYDDSGNPIDYFFLDANPAYKELTGVDPRGKPYCRLSPVLKTIPLTGYRLSVMSPGLENPFVSNANFPVNRCWYDCVGYQYKPDHFVAAFQNITERKLAVEALGKAEIIHRKMMANIGDVIVIIDKDGINRYKSPNVEKWFGWKAEELVGSSAWETVHCEDLLPAQQFLGAS